MSTPKLEIVHAVEGQAHGEVTFNEALNTLDTFSSLAVTDRDLATPPGSPAEGVVYLVAASGTGDWTGHDGDIAYYFSGWKFLTPTEGQTVYIKDEDLFLVYNSSAWVQVGTIENSWTAPSSGGYTTGLLAGTCNGSGMKAAGVIVAHPIIIPKTISPVKLVMACKTASSGHARIGIYRDSGGLPGSLVQGSGSITLADNSSHEYTFSPAITLAAGRYWLAYLGDTGTSEIAVSSNSNLPVGYIISGGGILDCLVIKRTFAFAALPDPFGTPDALDNTAINVTILLKM